MIYGYARCSTNETKQDVNRQVRELEKLGATEIYTEYASGTNSSRKEFTRLLDVLGSGDTLIATEVSRISRSTKQLLEIVDFAKENSISLNLGSLKLNFAEDKLDHISLAMVQIMGVFSELERNMISERTKSGLESARAKGVKLGRRKTSVDDIPQSHIEALKLVKDKSITKSQCSRMLQSSRTTIDKYLKLIENAK